MGIYINHFQYMLAHTNCSDGYYSRTNIGKREDWSNELSFIGLCTCVEEVEILMNTEMIGRASSPNQGALCRTRIYKQATIHMFFLALGIFWLRGANGGDIWNVFALEIYRTDGILFIVLLVACHLKALFDTTTTSLRWILLMKGVQQTFLDKEDN